MFEGFYTKINLMRHWGILTLAAVSQINLEWFYASKHNLLWNDRRIAWDHANRCLADHPPVTDTETLLRMAIYVFGLYNNFRIPVRPFFGRIEETATDWSDRLKVLRVFKRLNGTQQEFLNLWRTIQGKRDEQNVYEWSCVIKRY